MGTGFDPRLPTSEIFMLTKKEFYGDEHYAWCCQQYEKARVYLKNCGKPKNEFEKWLIEMAKFDSVHYKKSITDL